MNGLFLHSLVQGMVKTAYFFPDLLFPLLPKLFEEGFMFLVEPVFLPLELLDLSRNSLDLGFAFDERDGFFTDEEEGAR